MTREDIIEAVSILGRHGYNVSEAMGFLRPIDWVLSRGSRAYRGQILEEIGLDFEAIYASPPQFGYRLRLLGPIATNVKRLSLLFGEANAKVAGILIREALKG